MASRIESAETRPVGLTVFSNSRIVINGKRTISKIGVGSCPALCSDQSHTDLKMSISGAQKESLAMSSRMED